MTLHPARRSTLAAALALALGPMLAACGAGPDATASLDYAPADGLLGEVGGLRVQNVLVVAPPEGGDTAVVSMRVADGSGEGDRLVAVDAGDAGTAEVTGAAAVPPYGAVQFGAADAESQVLLSGFDAPPGSNITLTLRFARAGQLVLKPPVMAPTGYYEDFVAPTPAATPTPTPVPMPILTPTAG